MSRIGITVVGGLHDGAVVALVEGVPRRIGSGADVDILLVDDTVAESQCSILWEGGKVLSFEALANGMDAYGTSIEVGKQLVLPVGAVISLSPLQLMVVSLEDASSDAIAPLADPPTDEALRMARRQVLKQLRWFLYARELLQPSSRTCWVIGGIVVAGIVSTWIVSLLGAAPGPQQLRAEASARIQTLFPAVKVGQAGTTDTLLYEGYVRDQHELNLLRSIALGMDPGRTVLRVVPMDVLVFNASMWLDRYYQDAEVQSSVPGELQITVASGLAIRTLEGWDFSGVGKQLMHELPELRSVSIALADADGDEIPLLAAQLGLSFVPTSEGSVYVVGADGAALFAGAATPQGRIGSITECALLLHSSNTGSTFRLSSGNSRCGDTDVTPGTAGPSVHSVGDTTSP